MPYSNTNDEGDTLALTFSLNLNLTGHDWGTVIITGAQKYVNRITSEVIATDLTQSK